MEVRHWGSIGQLAAIAIATNLALAAPVSSAATSAGSALTPACHRFRSQGDVNARAIERRAQSAAELYGVDHRGVYRDLSPATLHAIDPTIPVTPGEAHRRDEHAFLSVARGVRTAYRLIALTRHGDRYEIRHTSTGVILRYAFVCRKWRRW
jgi:hypothetical protein